MAPLSTFLCPSPPLFCLLQIHADLASGAVDLVVGTHALITEKLEYKALGLAVVDEPHRWGPYDLGGSS